MNYPIPFSGVTEVSATLFVNGSPVNASPYQSSGTAHSQFAIISTSPTTFAVTRVTGASDSVDVGALLPAPTEQQQ